MYIGNYKGGRNESFMYGWDLKEKWFDYDLTSAYTTIMGFLGHPVYSQMSVLKNPLSLSDKDLINSYMIIKCKFKFPDSVKYPSIPCYVDDTTTVYPLTGEALLTGFEYKLAKSQGCVIEIDECFIIPFKKIDKNGFINLCESKKSLSKFDKDQEVFIESSIDKPYYEVIKELQQKRRLYPKKSLYNKLYKEMANSIYGNVVRGISNKRVFDIKSNGMVNLTANELSNPIIGSHITSMVRTVIGETLHNINKLGGKIVSVTTDGFITNIENLELLLMELPSNETYFVRLYRKMRKMLGFDLEAYELKNSGVGIAS